MWHAHIKAISVAQRPLLGYAQHGALKPRVILMQNHHVKGRLHTMQILLGKSAFATALPAPLDPFLASILMLESLPTPRCLFCACSRRVNEFMYIAGHGLFCATYSQLASTKFGSDLAQIKCSSWRRSECHRASRETGTILARFWYAKVCGLLRRSLLRPMLHSIVPHLKNANSN